MYKFKHVSSIYKHKYVCKKLQNRPHVDQIITFGFKKGKMEVFWTLRKQFKELFYFFGKN